jgi:uncharacterized membrane protein
MTEFAFQIPFAMLAGVIVVAALMVWSSIRMRKRRLDQRQLSILIAVRSLFLCILVLLVARPVWTAPERDEQNRNLVALLIDRSQSMSVREGDRTRYLQVVEFTRDVLLPAVDQSRLEIRPILFSEEARPVNGNEIASAKPDGPATNLGRAIVQSVLMNDPPPLVAIALTDGIVTQSADHSRAVAALVANAVPMVAIGFGSQSGGRVVRLEEASAPAMVEPDQTFRVMARLSATGEAIPALQLLLLKDDQLIDQRTIPAFDGPRTWTESFEVSADEQAMHTYQLRLMPPSDDSVTLANAEATALVRTVESNEIRVLYVQGGLTWDYKFATIAVSKDPAIRLSGLSRTANTSRFFENVQSDVDLVGGFPNSLEKLNEFRVVVLSNLRPGDLTPHQQQLLADFCGELGGGVLMIGGPQTFNASWRDSRLEQLLPVRFAVLPDRGLGQMFRLRPTAAAIRNPVFQLSDEVSAETVWRDLPQFTHRAVVEEVKPGAEIWLEDGYGSVLMASQRYGNGFASVICMQNLWRWRLTRENNPDHFDRFWIQLLRYLAEAGREVYTLTPNDLTPTPGERIELLIDHRAAAGEDSDLRRRVRLLVQDANQIELLNQTIEIETASQTTVSFVASQAGMVTAALYGPGNELLATRDIDVRDTAVELATTSRNMEVLRQFAGISGGVAVEAEAVSDLPALLDRYLQPEQPPRIETSYALPAGINGWILTLLLGCVSIEWLCRKRWNLL